MGITQFGTVLKYYSIIYPDELKKRIFSLINFTDVYNKIIIIDGNSVLFRLGSIIVLDEIKRNPTITLLETYCEVLNKFYAFISILKSQKNFVIVVVDKNKLDENQSKEIIMKCLIKESVGIKDNIESELENITLENKDEQKNLDDIKAKIKLLPKNSLKGLYYDENGVDRVFNAKSSTNVKRTMARQDLASKKGIAFCVKKELLTLLETTIQLVDVPLYYGYVEADPVIANLGKKLSSGELFEDFGISDSLKEHSSENVYIITEDTDLMIYDIGTSKILRKSSVYGRLKESSKYELLDISLFWKEFGMLSEGNINTDLLYRISVFLGCDYFDGVPKVGPKTLFKYFASNYSEFDIYVKLLHTNSSEAILKIFETLIKKYVKNKNISSEDKQLLFKNFKDNFDTPERKKKFSVLDTNYINSELNKDKELKKQYLKDAKDIITSICIHLTEQLESFNKTIKIEKSDKKELPKDEFIKSFTKSISNKFMTTPTKTKLYLKDKTYSKKIIPLSYIETDKFAKEILGGLFNDYTTALVTLTQFYNLENVTFNYNALTRHKYLLEEICDNCDKILEKCEKNPKTHMNIDLISSIKNGEETEKSLKEKMEKFIDENEYYEESDDEADECEDDEN